jgi:hypothetical protein
MEAIEEGGARETRQWPAAARPVRKQRRGGAGNGRRARQVGPTCRWLREREGEGSGRMWAGVGQKRAAREKLRGGKKKGGKEKREVGWAAGRG